MKNQNCGIAASRDDFLNFALYILNFEFIARWQQMQSAELSLVSVFVEGSVQEMSHDNNNDQQGHKDHGGV